MVPSVRANKRSGRNLKFITLAGLALSLAVGFAITVTIGRGAPGAGRNFAAATSKGKKATSVSTRYAGTIPAPDFPPGMDWLNTDKPITLKELKGKVVLLDFWTYC